MTKWQMLGSIFNSIYSLGILLLVGFFCFLSAHFYTDQFFYKDYLDIISKWLIQDGGSCRFFLIMNDVIMTSLLLRKAIVIHSKYFPNSDWLKAHA